MGNNVTLKERVKRWWNRLGARGQVTLANVVISLARFAWELIRELLTKR